MNEVLAFIVGAPLPLPPPSPTPGAGAGGGGGGGKKRTASEALGGAAHDREVQAMRAWKVSRLRDELQGRGLDTKGRRPELVERLERVILDQGAEEQPAGGASSSGRGDGGRRGSGAPFLNWQPRSSSSSRWSSGSGSFGSFSSSSSTSSSNCSSGSSGGPVAGTGV